jgi:hypothetical protein
LRTSPIPPYNNSSIGLSEETGPAVQSAMSKWSRFRTIQTREYIAVFSRTEKKKKKQPTPYSFSVTFFLPFGLRPFFILLQINTHNK